MNKAVVVAGSGVTLGGILLFTMYLLQPLPVNCGAQGCQRPSDDLYMTTMLPSFVLTGGIWMILMGMKRKHPAAKTS